jgi:hypothetical protein
VCASFQPGRDRESGPATQIIMEFKPIHTYQIIISSNNGESAAFHCQCGRAELIHRLMNEKHFNHITLPEPASPPKYTIFDRVWDRVLGFFG